MTHMSLKALPLCIAALMSSLAATPALAQMDLLQADGPCQMELSGDSSVEWRGLYGRGYEVTSDQQDFETVSVAIRHQGEGCEFFLVAMPSGAGGKNVLTGSGDNLVWDLFRETNGISLVSGAFFGTQDTQLRGQFGPGPAAQALTLFFTIPPSQFVRGGYYDGQVILRLFRDSLIGPELVSELPIALIAPVPTLLEVRSDTFAGGSQEITIDLGVLDKTVRRSVGFELVSNAAIGVTFNSRNNGVLAHQFGAAGIPYSVSLNGNDVPLAGITQQRLTMAGKSGTGANVEIVVPESQTVRGAGRYTDSLTVTFVADP